MHFRGPTDPRLDRFCRVLASAGFAVLSPFLADYLTLTLAPRVIDHLDRAFDALRGEPEGAGFRPAIFSISFGSYPAVGVASRRGAAVGGMVLFGAYARFQDIVRFSVSGRADLFNQAVAFKNLNRFLPGAPPDTTGLESAWLSFVTRVWNRPEMKSGERWKEEARAVAEGLPAGERELFLVGCGALPGGAAVAERALAAPDLPDLDPRPRGISCPVSIFHGATDDVIPPGQSRLLAEALGTKARLTGLYAHGDRADGSFLSALVGEVGTLLSILAALAAPAGAASSSTH